MPKRIRLNTHGMGEQEMLLLSNTEFLQNARDRGLTSCQLDRLKAYRRLLKVRGYGKDFRKRKREELRRLKETKLILEREATLLRQEIEWYKEQTSVLETLELLEQLNPY